MCSKYSSMKFLLLGNWKQNAGPCNVNRSLVENSDGTMRFLTWNRFSRIERLFKCIISNPIVISGGATNSEINIFKLLHKKIVYIFHGYYKYENEINNLNLSNKVLNNEAELLRIANIILPVSQNYSEWVKLHLPQYAHKIYFLNNGISICQREKTTKIPYSIAISGGNRPIKNASLVCEAVSKIVEQGYNCKVYVFGRFYKGGDDLSKYSFVIKEGHLNKEQYYNELDKISLFVVNSELESFGLVVADAINCNCSLLVSHNVGALSIISTTEDDVIFDTHNINELSTKILYLLQNSNSDRIYKSIDIQEVSEKNAFLKLKKIVNET